MNQTYSEVALRTADIRNSRGIQTIKPDIKPIMEDIH